VPFKFLEQKRAFTLIEFLIVVALVAVIVFLVVPIGIDFLKEQRIEEETISLADNIKIAQAWAMAGKYDSGWGVKLNKPEQGKYTLFPLFGTDSFDDPERNTDYDEVFEVFPTAELSGAEEIIFEKLTGKLIIKH